MMNLDKDPLLAQHLRELTSNLQEKTMHAFRCKNCGRLHSADHAHESRLPHACQVCGAGVVFDSKGNKSFQADNWEVLADAKPDRLAELGLTANDVVAHVPVPKAEAVQQDAERIKQNHAALCSKEVAWEKAKAKHVADFKALDARQVELEKLISATDDVQEKVRLIEENEQTKQAIQALVNCEPTARDAAHKKHLEMKLEEHAAGYDKLGTVVPGKHVKVSAFEGVGSRNFGNKS